MARTDEQLLGAWKQGDLRAGEELIHRHQSAVARFFLYAVGKQSDWDDLVQSTFQALLLAADRFRGDSSLRTYLLRIAYYKLLQHRKKYKRQQQRVEYSESALRDSAESPSQALARHRRHKLMVAALRTLPFEMQVILMLQCVDDMSIEAIALISNCSQTAVKGRLNRGRRRLAAAMKKLARSHAPFDTRSNHIEQWIADVRRGAALGV